jgi:hypothetical protein
MRVRQIEIDWSHLNIGDLVDRVGVAMDPIASESPVRSFTDGIRTYCESMEINLDNEAEVYFVLLGISECIEYMVNQPDSWRGFVPVTESSPLFDAIRSARDTIFLAVPSAIRSRDRLMVDRRISQGIEYRKMPWGDLAEAAEPFSRLDYTMGSIKPAYQASGDQGAAEIRDAVAGRLSKHDALYPIIFCSMVGPCLLYWVMQQLRSDATYMGAMVVPITQSIRAQVQLLPEERRRHWGLDVHYGY